ncbi:MAG TPA: hypothetical protein VEU50_18300, partial [Archangium sp.]|nr:hypothetical protein [Archangium sp.]
MSARERLARAQAELARALGQAGPVPEGFDAGHALTLSQLGKFVAESYTGPSRHQKVRPPGSRRASTRRPSAPTR